MAQQHGIPIYLSPRSTENTSGQHTPYTSAFGFQLQPPLSGSGPGPNQQARSSSSKRTLGRPRGSKNKPKPPIVITRDNSNGMLSAVIEVGAGIDVMQAVVQLARWRNVGIIVVHAAGTISNATLSHPVAQAPDACIVHGPFVLLGLSGSYFTPPALDAGFSSSSFPSFIPNLPPPAIHSTFKISLSSFQGKVFSGVVAGKVMAANNGVTVTALLFKNPEYHSFGVITEGDIVEEDIDNPRESGGGGDHGGASGSGGDDCANGFGMPGFKQV